jgi:hypothetical protein
LWAFVSGWINRGIKMKIFSGGGLKAALFSLFLFVFVSCLFLTGCVSFSTASAKEINETLPADTNQLLLTNSIIYRLTARGLDKGKIFIQWVQFKRARGIKTNNWYLRNLYYNARKNQLYFLAASSGELFTDRYIFSLNFSDKNAQAKPLIKNAEAMKFSPNGRLMAYVIKKELWLFDVDTLKARAIKRLDDAWESGTDKFIWLSNQRILYSVNEWRDLKVLDIKTLKENDFKMQYGLLKKMAGSYCPEAISPDGKKLVFTKSSSSFSYVETPAAYILDLQTMSLSSVKNVYIYSYVLGPFVWLPDSRGFLFLRSRDSGLDSREYSIRYFSISAKKEIQLSDFQDYSVMGLLPNNKSGINI